MQFWYISPKIIVLDPGHGGVDPGAIGRQGTYEKKIVLMAAKTIKKILVQTGRYEVVMTRKSDQFIALRKRVAIARRAQADLFISLHADSIKNGAVRGRPISTRQTDRIHTGHEFYLEFDHK